MVLSHYLTPVMPQHAILHDIYRRILYIPIILAAFWYGWRGGLLCAGLIGASYFPHIFHDWGGGVFNVNLNRTLEALMYLIVGGITGGLIDHLRRANQRLASQSTKLQETMDALTVKTREIFETEEQLRQADRLTALGQLAAGLAHEIRNPLGSIRGATEILGDEDTSPDQREEFKRIMIAETDRLDNVLRNFLEYARSQRNGLSSESCRLAPIVNRLLKLMERKLESTRVEIDLSPEPLPAIAMGEGLMQQILLNLILNSLQAMSGGGTLRIETKNVPTEDKIRLIVADTGPGIPHEVRERMYDPFFTTKASGTGLGLSIVQKVVIGHKGRVWVDENYHAGTRMIIELPTRT
ncbi:sensor histidine kinase [bacterium]|nr:sensor histidine kinase [bacterium]